MSASLMFAIAILYGAAAFSFTLEDKWMWAGVALCWGIGNALLAVMSK